MKPRNRLLSSLIALAFVMAFTATTQAAAIVYSVTFSANARFFPKHVTRGGNTFSHRGFLIYNPANPASSITVELIPGTKTYRIQGAMINNIAPSSIGFGVLDRNSDAFPETQAGLIGFTSGVTVSRSYVGLIPRAGFRFGNSVPITGIARVLRGFGSVTGADHFRTAEVWRVHPFTAAQPLDTNAGLALVTANLAGRGFSQVP